MFPGFEEKTIAVNGTSIHLFKGGQGPPLLLLHGYPQTYYLWHMIAPRLAQNFTVITTDLRGYGDSGKPAGESNHENYSKRVMALDQVLVMEQLGFEKFSLVGHDRGARVAHRLTLDHPQRVSKLALLDIAPTLDMYEQTDQAFARAYYHWFFLIQPAPLPETLIGADPDFYLKTCLKAWSQDYEAFSDKALAEYQRCFRDRTTIHGTCEDYRASAGIDLEHDRSDHHHKITCPLLVLWGAHGVIECQFKVLQLWRERAAGQVTGNSIDSGHFLPEEAPDETYEALVQFLLSEE